MKTATIGEQYRPLRTIEEDSRFKALLDRRDRLDDNMKAIQGERADVQFQIMQMMNPNGDWKRFVAKADQHQ